MTTIDIDAIKQQVAAFDTSAKEIDNHIAQCNKRMGELLSRKENVIVGAILDSGILTGTAWKITSNGREIFSKDDRLAGVNSLLQTRYYGFVLCDNVSIRYDDYYGTSLYGERPTSLTEFARKYGLVVDRSAIDKQIAEMKKIIEKLEEV